MTPRLSVCIPTHDGRAGVLRETLDGVLEQATGGPTGDLRAGLQICISDNASADGTEAMVAGYSRAHPGLFVYSRSPTNEGFLGNLLRVTAMAGGDFCWLLSSDDQIAPGGLARVMRTLEEHPETTGVTVFAEGFDRDMAARSAHQNNPVILPDDAGRMHVYEAADEIFRNCGLFHGCFSAQIVSRGRWDAALAALGRDGLARNAHFPHLLLIGLMVKRDPRWIWLPELTVKARRDNDALTSHLGQNLLRYQLETMRDLSQAWATLLGRRSPLYRDLMARAHADQWNGGAICALKIRSRCGPGDDWAVLVGYTRHLYFLPEYWRSSLPFALIPAFVLRLGSRMRLGPRLRAPEPAQRRRGAGGGAMTFSRRLLQRIGVDRTVGYALMARGWTAISGLLGLAIMTRFLSPAEQGYYYTFNSVLGFTLLLEMGLTYVILQVASHERAGLEWTAGGVLEGDPVAKARLASLLRLSLLWYGCLALLVVGLVLPAGLLFFSRHTPPGAHVAWQWPWAGVVVASAGILALSPILALIEGLGRVAAVTQTQMFQSLAGSLVLWLALFLHCGLFAAAIFNATVLLFQAVWLWRRQGPFLRDLLRAARPGVRIGWRDEIWPFQWKIAVSSISGLFVFLFNPLMLAAHGAAQAGRLGLSLTVMGAITLIGLSWVTTKSAPFGTLIARGDWRELDRRFFPCLWQSWAVVALGGTAFWTAAFVLHQLHHRLAGRMLAPLPLALLVGTALINHVITSQALYLRAHKQDPFLPLSLTVGALVALSSVLVVRPYGATGLMLGYFLVYLLVGLGGGTWLFVRARRRWHRDSPPVPRPPAPLAATGAGR